MKLHNMEYSVPALDTMVGPEIPAHLLRNTNVDTSSEEETSSNDKQNTIGPQIPENLHVEEGGELDSQQPQVGPHIPPEFLQQQRRGEAEEEEEEEEDYTPALPPELLAQRSQPLTTQPKLPPRESQLSPSVAKPDPPRRRMGPSFPPHPSHQYQDEDSDDDDVGPKPLPAGLQPMHEKDAVAEFIEREERRRKNEEVAKEPKALKREEWMLVPPSSSDLLGSKC